MTAHNETGNGTEREHGDFFEFLDRSLYAIADKATMETITGDLASLQQTVREIAYVIRSQGWLEEDQAKRFGSLARRGGSRCFFCGGYDGPVNFRIRDAERLACERCLYLLRVSPAELEEEIRE